MPEGPRRPDQGRQAAGAAGRLARAPASRSPSTPAQADADILSPGHEGPAHLRQRRSTTRWVTIHDTDGRRHDAVRRQRARQGAARATPFKRPENGQFRPGTGFREFFFDETGDTDTAPRPARDYGGFGGVLKLDPGDPSADDGTLRLFYHGDVRPTPASTTSRSSTTRPRSRSSRTPATRCTPSATRSTPATCSTLDADYAKPARQPGAHPRRGPRRRRRRSTRALPGTPGSRTTATTRSPASTSPTATRDRTASSAPRSPHAVHGRLAAVLHPAARRQRDLGDPPGARRARRH